MTYKERPERRNWGGRVIKAQKTAKRPMWPKWTMYLYMGEGKRQRGRLWRALEAFAGRRWEEGRQRQRSRPHLVGFIAQHPRVGGMYKLVQG